MYDIVSREKTAKIANKRITRHKIHSAQLCFQLANDNEMEMTRRSTLLSAAAFAIRKSSNVGRKK